MLVVDDEPQIVRGLKIILRDAGYTVESAETKAQALALLGSRPPDALVLDLVLPDGEGVEVCREVRRFSGLPILVLSAVGDEREKVRALDAGADDYVTKPFGTDELLARLRAVMRRSADPGAGSQVTVGELVIDVLDRRVTRAGEEVHLTPIEFDLLPRARPAPRPARHPPPAAAGGVGSRVRAGDPLPAGARRAHPRQARGRPVAAAVPDHRAGGRVPAARHRRMTLRVCGRADLRGPATVPRQAVSGCS